MIRYTSICAPAAVPVVSPEGDGWLRTTPPAERLGPPDDGWALLALLEGEEYEQVISYPNGCDITLFVGVSDEARLADLVCQMVSLWALIISARETLKINCPHLNIYI